MTPIESCNICHRPVSQLEPFDQIDQVLWRTYRRDMDQMSSNLECKDCIGVAVYPSEVYGKANTILLWYSMDTDVWTTFDYPSPGDIPDSLMSEISKYDKDLFDFLLEHYRDNPDDAYTHRTLHLHDVERIKVMRGKTIIVVTTKEVIDERSGHSYQEICSPPEIITNLPSLPIRIGLLIRILIRNTKFAMASFFLDKNDPVLLDMICNKYALTVNTFRIE